MKPLKTGTAMVMFLFLCIATVGAAAIRDRLVGYWPFDEQAGMIAPSGSGIGQPGTLVNFTNDNRHWVTGQIAGALRFRGSNYAEYVRVPDYVKARTTMTLSMWVHAESYSPWTVIAKSFSYAHSFGPFSFHTDIWGPNLTLHSAQERDSAGTIVVNTLRDPGVLPLRVWNHVGFVADGTNINIWRNGAFVASAGYDGTIIYAFSPVASLEIGGTFQSYLGGTSSWHGSIDDVGFWTRALSSTEMTDVYRAGLAGRPLISVNYPPIISAIGNQTVIEDGPPISVPFTTSDPETPASALEIRATSSNPFVVSDADIRIAGTSSNRVVTLSPVSNGHGTTVITVNVTDSDGATTSTPFTVVVLGVNDPPVATATMGPLFTAPFELPYPVVLSANGSNAIVQFDASASSDIDSESLNFSWFVVGLPEPFAFGVGTSNRFGMGHNTVVLVVDDGEITSTAHFTFEVISLADAINLLIAALEDSPLPRRSLRPLIATLKSAAAAAGEGQISAAWNQLRAFERKLELHLDPANPLFPRLKLSLQQIDAALMGE
jgi:hypothetical protein